MIRVTVYETQPRVKGTVETIAPHDTVDVALVSSITVSITNNRNTPVYVVSKL